MYVMFKRTVLVKFVIKFSLFKKEVCSFAYYIKHKLKGLEQCILPICGYTLKITPHFKDQFLLKTCIIIGFRGKQLKCFQ